MEDVLRLPLSPAPTRRRARVVVAVAALVLGLMLVGQRSGGVPVSSLSSPRLPGAAALSGPSIPRLEQAVSGPKTSDAPPKQAVALIDRAMGFIEPFEGRRHRAYRDSRGYLTIGVGFNLDRAGAAEDVNRLLPGVGYRAIRRGDLSLTDAQIDVLLRHDTRRAMDTARRQVAGFDSLPVEAQLIVIDMTFNTGSLHKWRKLRAALVRQDYASAADAMHRSLWRKQTGQRAQHLIELMRNLSRV